MDEDDTDCAHDDTHTQQYARTHATCVFLPCSIKGTTYHTVDYYPYSSLGCMESCGPVWIYPLGLRASQETTAKRKTMLEMERRTRKSRT